MASGSARIWLIHGTGYHIRAIVALPTCCCVLINAFNAFHEFINELRISVYFDCVTNRKDFENVRLQSDIIML